MKTSLTHATRLVPKKYNCIRDQLRSTTQCNWFHALVVCELFQFLCRGTFLKISLQGHLSEFGNNRQRNWDCFGIFGEDQIISQKPFCQAILIIHIIIINIIIITINIMMTGRRFSALARRFPPPPLSCNHCRAHPCFHQGGGGGGGYGGYQHG